MTRVDDIFLNQTPPLCTLQIVRTWRASELHAVAWKEDTFFSSACSEYRVEQLNIVPCTVGNNSFLQRAERFTVDLMRCPQTCIIPGNHLFRIQAGRREKYRGERKEVAMLVPLSRWNVIQKNPVHLHADWYHYEKWLLPLLMSLFAPREGFFFGEDPPRVRLLAISFTSAKVFYGFVILSLPRVIRIWVSQLCTITNSNIRTTRHFSTLRNLEQNNISVPPIAICINDVFCD